MIQVTAPIHPGNSGGPLFNLAGEVTGIITAMHTRGPSDEGIGFAIPLSPFKQHVIRTLAAGQTVAYGYAGMTARAANPAERETLGGRPAVVVQKLESGGPAAAAGLRVGDIILGYGGVTVTGPGQMAELVGQTPVGTPVRVHFHRGPSGRDAPPAEPLEVELIVGKREASRVSWLRGDSVLWRGARLANLQEEVRRRLPVGNALTGVVVIDIEEDSPAARAGLRIGDVIEQVGTHPVHSVMEFIAALRETDGPVDLVVRDTGRRTVETEPEGR
jgi:S1-C subfamily serine protease